MRSHLCKSVTLYREGYTLIRYISFLEKLHTTQLHRHQMQHILLVDNIPKMSSQNSRKMFGGNWEL